MARLSAKIECCGSNLRTDNVSTFGILTFSMPYVLFFLVVWPLLYCVGAVFGLVRRLADVMMLIFKANMKLIEQAEIAPKLKCAISGKLVSSSMPWYAGLVFRYFNISILTTVLLLVVFTVGAWLWR